jgi:hypothetical protein
VHVKYILTALMGVDDAHSTMGYPECGRNVSAQHKSYSSSSRKCMQCILAALTGVQDAHSATGVIFPQGSARKYILAALMGVDDAHSTMDYPECGRSVSAQHKSCNISSRKSTQCIFAALTGVQDAHSATGVIFKEAHVNISSQH